jgi:hypothetical protein
MNKKAKNKKMKTTTVNIVRPSNQGRASIIHAYRDDGVRMTTALKSFHDKYPKMRVTPSLFARIWKRGSRKAAVNN